MLKLKNQQKISQANNPVSDLHQAKTTRHQFSSTRYFCFIITFI